MRTIGHAKVAVMPPKEVRLWGLARKVYNLTGWKNLRKGLVVRLEFKPADLWVGVYAKLGDPVMLPEDPRQMVCPRHVWVCVLPCLPVHFHWYPGRPVLKMKDGSKH